MVVTSHDVMAHDITCHYLHALVALSSGLNVGGAGRSREPSERLVLRAALICSNRSSPNLTRFLTAVATFGSLTFFSYGGEGWEG